LYEPIETDRKMTPITKLQIKFFIVTNCIPKLTNRKHISPKRSIKVVVNAIVHFSEDSVDLGITSQNNGVGYNWLSCDCIT